MGEEYKDFQKKKIYGCLVDYKERHITRDSGKYKGEENGAPDKPCGVGRADANPKLLLNDT